MLTWALVYLVTIVEELPLGAFLFLCAMAGDVAMVAVLAWALRGRAGGDTAPALYRQVCPVCGQPGKIQLTGKGKPYVACDEHKVTAFCCTPRYTKE